MLVALLLFNFIIGGFYSPISIKASSYYGNFVKLDLKPYYVSDLDNILYPATSHYFVYDGLQGVGSFTVNKPTIVRAHFNWYVTTSKKVSGTVWFSRDKDGLDLVGAPQKITKVGDSILAFLDPGQYYINHHFEVRDGSNSSYIEIGVALLAEDTLSTENIYVSSYTSPNNLELNKPVRGFLSDVSPIDYYKFELKDRSKVSINFNFEATGGVSLSNGTCTLYDSQNQKLIAKRYNSSGAKYNVITEMLEPGIYYISLSGVTGATNLEVKAISYEVKSKLSDEEWTNENVTVKLLPEFEPTEILYVDKKVSDVKIKDSKTWNIRYEDCHEVEYNTFEITKNGWYTVRLRDNEGNFVLSRIQITNIDKKAPTISGVANKKSYKKGTIIKFSDKDSGIRKATLNGKNVKSGVKATTIGKNTLKVYDNAGNVKSIIFYIK